VIGVLIVSHGRLAEELLAAAQTIAGALPRFRAVALDWTVGFEEARQRIAASAGDLDDGSGVLVLTDMFGDTPSNAAVSLYRPGALEVVSGVNLPMVVRLGCTRAAASNDLAEVARWLEAKGRRGIRRAAEEGTPEAGGTNGSGK
jgi:PTS system mannose-specific IIA component